MSAFQTWAGSVSLDFDAPMPLVVGLPFFVGMVSAYSLAREADLSWGNRPDSTKATIDTGVISNINSTPFLARRFLTLNLRCAKLVVARGRAGYGRPSMRVPGVSGWRFS